MVQNLISYSCILAGFSKSYNFLLYDFFALSHLFINRGFLSLLPFARFYFPSCITFHLMLLGFGVVFRSLTFCLTGFSRSASVFGPSKSNTCISTSFFTILPSANFSLDRASPKGEFRHQSCYHLQTRESIPSNIAEIDHYA